MSLDNDKFIASQAIMKSLIESMPNTPDALFEKALKARFDFCIKIMEEYATINPDDEFINTGVRVPKAYWDTRKQEIIGEGNRPQKVDDQGWFIFSRRKDVFAFKELMDKRDALINGGTI